MIIARVESSAAADSHAYDRAVPVLPRLELFLVENPVSFIASYPDVNIASQTNLNSLARPVEVPVWNWAADFLAQYGQSRFSHCAANVEATVKVIEGDSAECAPRLADHPGYLVWLVPRLDRPEIGSHAAKVLVESRNRLIGSQ